MRFEWETVSLSNIHAGDWDAIRNQIKPNNPTKGQATTDYNRLHDICLSTPDDLWITFHESKLWWCHLTSYPVGEDLISKFRRVDKILPTIISLIWRNRYKAKN